MWLKVKYALYTINTKHTYTFPLRLCCSSAGACRNAYTPLEHPRTGSALLRPQPRGREPWPAGTQPAPAQPGPGADQGRRPTLGALQHLCVMDQRRTQHRQLLVRHWLICAGPGWLADSVIPGDRRGAGVLLHELVGLYGAEDRGAVSGDQPHQLRHSRRTDSGLDPCGYCDCLVWYPDLPGLGGVPSIADGDSSGVCRL